MRHFKLQVIEEERGKKQNSEIVGEYKRNTFCVLKVKNCMWITENEYHA